MKQSDQFGEYIVTENEGRPVRPAVSVVMSAYNASEHMANCLYGMANQIYKDYELIIINDCSEDGTLQLIEKFARNDPRIVVIENSRNIGLTKSLIRGIGFSRGQLIARHDADDVSLPERLERQIKFFPRYDLVCCPTMVNGKRMRPTVAGIWAYRLILKHHNVFVHGTFVFKREFYDRLGGYDPEFFYAQDYDFIVRAINAGCEIKFMPEVLYLSSKAEGCISVKDVERQNYFGNLARAKYKLFA